MKNNTITEKIKKSFEQTKRLNDIIKEVRNDRIKRASSNKRY